MPAPFLSSNPSPLVSTGPAAPSLNMAHPLTPVSTDLGVHPTPPTHKEVGQWPGGSRKRKRETSLNRMQQPPFASPQGRGLANTIDASAAPRATMPTSHEHYTRPWKSRRSDPFDGGYMSDSPPVVYRGQRAAQRKDQIASGSRLHFSGYESDQPLPSMRTRLSSGVLAAAQEPHQGSERRVSSLLLLQPPPTPMEGSQRMHDKVVSFLQDSFMEDAAHWNEFTRDRAHVGSLSNAALLRVYWFAQGRLDTWAGSRLPKHLNYKKVEIVSKHPFAIVVFADSLIIDFVFCSVPGGGFFFFFFFFFNRETSLTRWGSRRIGTESATRRFRS